MLLQHVSNAILLGGIYACIGVGFSLVYGVMNIINLAHGAIVMMGAYLTYWLFALYGIDPFLSIPISVTVFYLVGYVLQKWILNKVIRGGGGKIGILMTSVSTYGLALIIVNIALFLWTADYKVITTSYSGIGFQVGHVIIPYIRLGIFAASCIITVILWLFMKNTRTGNAIKATALNKTASQIVGVDIDHIYSVTFGITSALAAAAGSLIATIFVTSPAMESSLMATAVIVAILGGLGSMSGAIVGGIILAFAETAGVLILGPSYQKAIGFAIVLLVVIFMPHGVIGKKFYAEL